MKRLFGFLCVLFPTVVFGADISVDITSFIYTGNSTRAAELCGKVTGSRGMTIVRVTVDELSKTPGQYRTIVDSDGQFCLVVSTNKGTAVAEVKDSGTVSFDNATVSSGQR